MAGFQAICMASRGFSRHFNKHYNTIQGFKCITRGISSTCCRNGLEEFFPPGVLENGKPSPEEVRTGRRWHASDLRLKSTSDLHKLWYVLLKEMNMLQTLKEEARRLQVPMPSPERIKKVQKSMAMIKVVVSERERAVKSLEKLGYQSVATAEELGTSQPNENKTIHEVNEQIDDRIHSKSSKDNMINIEDSKLSVT